MVYWCFDAWVYQPQKKKNTKKTVIKKLSMPIQKYI